MRRLRVAALAGAALAAVSLAAGAGAARAPFALAVGDTVAITGSPIACTATGNATARGLFCSLPGTGGVEPEGSYGVALSAQGEALVIQFAKGGARVAPRKLWRVKAVHRAAGAAPAPRTTAIGDAFTLQGTDLRCEVKRAGFIPGVVCSRWAGAAVRPNTNSIAITAEAAGVYRYDDKRRAVRKIEKAEPSSG